MILTGAVPPAGRGRALGWSAVAVALGTSTGPTLGALLTEHLSWRWIFYVNVPIGIGAIGATLRLFGGAPGGGEWRGRVGPVGAMLLAVGVAALTLGLTHGEQWGWSSGSLLGTAGLGLGALAGAVLAERRAPNPVVDLGLFRDRAFVSALASTLLGTLALFAVSFLLPFYFEELRGFSTAHSGWRLTPLPLAIAVVAPTAGAVADRLNSRWLAPLGLAPAAEQGEASGLLATARVTGQALSWRRSCAAASAE
ncbi:MAG TPA: MFS transporter [Gemmatimonadaceae bacterium]|nr:MFS transporter [Gemmatimonadaceae bacterium]